MDVDMGDLLSCGGAIMNHDRAVLHPEVSAQATRDLADTLHQRVLASRREVADALRLLDGNHQRVALGSRVDVEEGDPALALGNE
jgi:hypothetical protein